MYTLASACLPTCLYACRIPTVESNHENSEPSEAQTQYDALAKLVPVCTNTHVARRRYWSTMACSHIIGLNQMKKPWRYLVHAPCFL